MKPFLTLVLATFVFIFFVGWLTFQNNQNKHLTTILPKPASQSSFILAVQNSTDQQTDLELRLVSPLTDITAFSLRLNHQGRITQLKTSPVLEKAGWLFPIQKVSTNRLELSGVYPKLEQYSFLSEKAIASFTVKGFFDPQTFKLDPEVTKLISKSGEAVTPVLRWEKI